MNQSACSERQNDPVRAGAEAKKTKQNGNMLEKALQPTYLSIAFDRHTLFSLPVGFWTSRRIKNKNIFLYSLYVSNIEYGIRKKKSKYVGKGCGKGFELVLIASLSNQNGFFFFPSYFN